MSRSVKKLLFVTPRLEGGGAEKHLLLLARELAEDPTLEIHVAVLQRAVSNRVIENYPKLFFHFLGRTSSRQSSLLRATRAYSGLKILYRELCPSMLYSCLEWSNILCARLVGNENTKTRWVAGVQNPLQLLSRGNWYRRLLRHMHNRLLERAALIVTPTQGLSAEVSQLDALIKTKCIPNAVNLPASNNRTAALFDRSGCAIGYCGRLEEQKNPCCFVRTIGRLQTHVPVTGIMVGSGSLQSVVAGEIARLGLTSTIVQHQFCEDPWELLCGIRVLVITSLFEGFGNVIVEAFARSIPVVGFAVPYGPQELIIDGYNGFLVTPGDELQLEQRLLEVILNEQLCTQLGDNALKMASDFSSTVIAKRYLAVLSSN